MKSAAYVKNDNKKIWDEFVGEEHMKWQEVRELFPDQFVLVSIINYHEEDNKKIVDEVAPIRIISEQDANKEVFQVKPGNMVYRTSNQDFVIHLRRDPLMRVRRNTNGRGVSDERIHRTHSTC